MNYTLITGASSGIGLELCHLLAEAGNNIILVARKEKELYELRSSLMKQYDIQVEVIIKDLAAPNAPKEIYTHIMNREIKVDTLINNAGVGSFGPFSKISLEKDMNLIDVNIRALTELTKLFLPELLKREKGRILNVASTAGFMPGPYMATYYASKAYVISFTEALASELKGTAVTVSVLCPGPTKTGFQAKAEMKKSDFVTLGVMEAKAVALCGFNGMLKGKTIIIPGALNKLLVYGSKLFPRKLLTALAKSTQKIN
ncbi:SDR family NAD(P)-dependent oxidoreductase [Alloiococcus sp. CFN-8]|uniref:SDR family NAD(P)-dependent oxidoreductase n=1 Tax=Alloiococcus sp. CFN-8 TaxID=3416081 RepID=UPI003CEAD16C